MPAEVIATLASHPDFGEIASWDAEPEAKMRFDDFRGEPRNADVAVRVQDQHGHYLLAVEAKTDEPFGETVGDTLADALERSVQIKSSKGIDRMRSLALGLFVSDADRARRIALLRYQLLTSTAGALAEAQRLGLPRAVLMIHEIKTDKGDVDKHARNAEDLDRFAERLSRGTITKVENGQLYGPITVVGEGSYSKPPALYLAKATRDLRTRQPLPGQLALD